MFSDKHGNQGREVSKHQLQGLSVGLKNGWARRLLVSPGTTARLTAGDLGRRVQASSPPPSTPLAHPHQPP